MIAPLIGETASCVCHHCQNIYQLFSLFMDKHFNITIWGLVQGVWYRGSAQQQARLLGLTGFVQNLPDGGVYAEAEGPEAVLFEFVKWCRRGPELAKVDEVQVTEDAVLGFADFAIRR